MAWQGMKKGKQKAKRLPEVLTREEAVALLQQTSLRAPTGLRNRAGLMLMLRAGLRVSEVSNLRLQDVLLSNGSPRVLVHQGKGRKDRTVPLPSDVVDTLLRWQDRRKGFARRSPWVFCTITEGKGQGFGEQHDLRPGQRVSESYWRAAVKRYAKRAGIERRVHPHVLRHSFATEKLREGWDLESLRTILGHSSVAVTQVYLHVDEARLAELQAKAEPLPL